MRGITKSALIIGVAALTVALPASAKSPMIWNAHCIGEVVVKDGSRYINTSYMTQIEKIALPDDGTGGGGPALQAYSKAAYAKWQSWREGQPGMNSHTGNCHFDYPGKTATYDTHKKNIEQSISWGPDRYLKHVQFEFPTP